MEYFETTGEITWLVTKKIEELNDEIIVNSSRISASIYVKLGDNEVRVSDHRIKTNDVNIADFWDQEIIRFSEVEDLDVEEFNELTDNFFWDDTRNEYYRISITDENLEKIVKLVIEKLTN